MKTHHVATGSHGGVERVRDGPHSGCYGERGAKWLVGVGAACHNRGNPVTRYRDGLSHLVIATRAASERAQPASRRGAYPSGARAHFVYAMESGLSRRRHPR